MPQLTHTPLFCDNQATLHVSSNLNFYDYAKHIEIDCDFVYDELQAQHISPVYVPITFHPVDIFTKALRQSHFQSLMSKLGICNLYVPT